LLRLLPQPTLTLRALAPVVAVVLTNILPVLGGGVPPARAAAPLADEAQFRFLRGNAMYRAGRFEDALSEYYLSHRLVPNRNVQFNIARCLERLRRFDEAFRTWSQLSDGDLPDAERAIVREAIDRLRPQLALLRVGSDPPGADIYLGRRDLGSLGQTPKLIAVPEGKATLILELDGHRPAELPVEPQRGKEQVVSHRLERVYGRVALTNLPAGARVRRGSPAGESLSVGPGELRLPLGREVLYVTLPGYETARVEVDVAGDALTTVPVALRPALTGSIVVRANVEGALVRVDGREVGFTPLVIEKVAPGRRLVEASKEGHVPQRQLLEVKASGPSYLDLRLRSVAPQVSGATKELVAAAEAPASITVITAEEITAFGYTTLADALAGVRGVFASDDRIYRSVGIRGFSPPGDYTNRLLILIDGHPINEVLTGQGFVGREFDVDLGNVERIEVARGPGAVLYGTGALFGVVNVVTRRPPPGTHASAGVQGGTLGLGAARVTAAARGPRLEVTASGALLHQVGQRRYPWADPPPGSPDAAAPEALLADAETARHAELRARAGPVTLAAAINERVKDVPTGAFATRPEPGSRYRDLRGFVELRAARALGRSQLSARASYDESRFRGHYRLLPDAGGAARPDLEDHFTARWLTGELRLELPPFMRQRLTVGGEVQSQFLLDLGSPSLAAQRAADAIRELVLSGYVNDELALGSRLRVNVGLRVDHHGDSFGTTFNPRLAVIGRPYAGGNSKLLLGRAFRAPSSYERFYNDGGVTQRQAGTTLVPESTVSAELEHAHAVGGEMVLAGSLFGYQLDDLIILAAAPPAPPGAPAAPTAPPGQLLAFQNQSARVRGLGAEAELRWEPQPGILLSAAMTLTRVRAADPTAGAPDDQRPFPNAPQALASLRWLYPLIPERLRLGSELLLDSGRRTRAGRRLEDALLWNVTLSGAYAPWHLRYFAGLFNVLDVNDRWTGFPTGLEVPAPTVLRYGRSGRVGLQVAF
jgi:outer membrane receptor for ferrienterochelin and colicins